VGSCFGGISHFIIDAAKLSFQTKKKKMVFYRSAVAYFSDCRSFFLFNEFNFELFKNQEFLKIIMAALFLTTPASILSNIIVIWTPVPDTE
jgi:hypothetical protein